MGLTKETYKSYDIARKYIPTLEIRFLGEQYELWVDGAKISHCQGSDAYINNYLDSVFYGIKIASQYKSLKHKLTQL